MKAPLRVSLRRIAWGSLRMYVAPLVGAVKGIVAEWEWVEGEIERRRLEEEALYTVGPTRRSGSASRPTVS